MVKTFSEINRDFRESYDAHECKDYLTPCGLKAFKSGDEYCNANGCYLYSTHKLRGFNCRLCQVYDLLKEISEIERMNKNV